MSTIDMLFLFVIFFSSAMTSDEKILQKKEQFIKITLNIYFRKYQIDF